MTFLNDNNQEVACVSKLGLASVQTQETNTIAKNDLIKTRVER